MARMNADERSRGLGLSATIRVIRGNLIDPDPTSVVLTAVGILLSEGKNLRG
jgi:hypothetical protein